MRNLFALVSLTVLLAILATVPAAACTQRCRFSGGGSECDTVGWVTNMSCYMNGPSCIEVQEYGCWAPKEEDKAKTLAQQIGMSSDPAPVCTAENI
jgi:hypothetical protein